MSHCIIILDFFLLDILWNKEDIDGMPSSPLAVSTDRMTVFTMSLLQFQNFEISPEKMILNNNGRTGMP